MKEYISSCCGAKLYHPDIAMCKECGEYGGVEEVIEDPNHPYGEMEVGNFDHEIMINGYNIIEAKDNLTKDINNLVNKTIKEKLERIKTNFMTEFTDQDTGVLNIGKYDYERIINFFNREINDKTS